MEKSQKTVAMSETAVANQEIPSARVPMDTLML